MSKVYLAMYKARGNLVDKIIRLCTGKPYSHCEVIEEGYELICYSDWVTDKDRVSSVPCYRLYSSSPRDDGVRCKTILQEKFKSENWDLIQISHLTSGQKIKQFYEQTQGKKYDFLGAIGCVLPLRQKPSRYYCSEWCYEAILGEAPKKALSPNKLAELIKGGFTSHKV